MGIVGEELHCGCPGSRSWRRRHRAEPHHQDSTWNLPRVYEKTKITDVTWAPWRFKLTITRLFVQQLVHADVRENTKAPHDWLFVKGIHRWPVDSPHKWPVMRKSFSTALSHHWYILGQQCITNRACSFPGSFPHWIYLAPRLIKYNEIKSGRIQGRIFKDDSRKIIYFLSFWYFGHCWVHTRLAWTSAALCLKT